MRQVDVATGEESVERREVLILKLDRDVFAVTLRIDRARVFAERAQQRLVVRTAHARDGRAAHQLIERALRYEPALLDDRNVRARALHLVQKMARHENRATLVGER